MTALLKNLGVSELNTRVRWSLVANAAACTGCQICETVCSLIKTGQIMPELARLKVEREPFEGRFSPRVCHQCSLPECLKACPEGAIGVFPQTGAILIESKTCLGCGSCAEACPYDMIVLDAGRAKSFKCDLCGGQPECVEACPTHALGMAFFGPRR